MTMQSYVCGTSDMPLLYKTIGAQFDECVSTYSDHEAIVVSHQNIRWSYQELADAVDRFATGLITLGLEPGDRIGIWAPHSIEWVITQFATAKAGLILVNVNPAYRLSELEYALNKVGCKALVTADQFKSSDYIGMLQKLAPEIDGAELGQLNAKTMPTLQTLIHTGNATINGF